MQLRKASLDAEMSYSSIYVAVHRAEHGQKLTAPILPIGFTMTPLRFSKFPILSFLLATAAVGCGASALPVSQMAPPREAISAADELGAEKNPRAALHLKLARDQVAQADKLLKDGDERGAQLALLAANADAQLALELAREEKSRLEAEEAQTKIGELMKKTQNSPQP